MTDEIPEQRSASETPAADVSGSDERAAAVTRRRRFGSTLPLLAALVLGFAGGVGGFALANEVWEDGAGGTTIGLQPTNKAGSDDQSAPEGPADEGDELTPGELYQLAGPAVVHITSQISVTDSSFFGIPQEREGRGSGSGFVIDEQGHIVTNAHVVENATRIEVSFDNDETVEAELVGEDPSTDIAVIKVDASDDELEDALRPLQFGDSAAVEVGDPVAAIGNPFNLDRTLTTGIVSALQREIPALDDFTISNVIQTDAAVNPGNSGGPLLNMRGQVIGVNSQIQSRGGDFAGIAFAVPSETVTNVAKQLIEDGRVSHAWLGLAGTDLDPEVAKLLNLPVKEGVLVGEVTPGSPAAKAGLKGGSRRITIDGSNYTLGGDILTSANGKEITSMREVVHLVNSAEPGDEIEFVYYRGDDRREVEIELGERPQAGKK